MLYEYQREWDISISEVKQIKSYKFIFQESKSSIQEEAVLTVKKSSKENYLVYKTNQNIFANLIIIEIFSELSCSELEDAQQFIVTKLTEKFWIIKEEPDLNYLFSGLKSRLNFVSWIYLQKWKNIGVITL